MSATPGPWRVQREDVVTPGRPRLTEWHIYRVGGPFGHPATCELEEDAELIVRAVNAHESLVATLEAVAPVIESIDRMLDGWNGPGTKSPLGPMVRAALKKAGR